MGAPEVEDAARGGEGAVLKIQASGFQGCCPDVGTDTYLVDKPSLVQERRFNLSDQGHE